MAISPSSEPSSEKNPPGSELDIPTLQPLAREKEPSGKRQDALENRERILTTARKLFAERGVGPVSMNQIAHEVGIGPGTLYRHFSNKEELCATLSEESTWQLYEDTQRTIGVFAEGTSALGQLEIFLTRLITYNEENTPYLSAIFAGDWNRWPNGQYQNPLYIWLYQTVMVLLKRAVTIQELPEHDSEWMADAILGMLQTSLYHYQRQQRNFSQARIVKAVSEMLHMLRKARVES